MIIRFKVFILNEVVVFLVNGVIREMYILVVLPTLLTAPTDVLFASKSRQTFFIDVNAKGLQRSNDHVNSQIKFMPINQ